MVVFYNERGVADSLKKHGHHTREERVCRKRKLSV